jgi:ribonuclease E
MEAAERGGGLAGLSGGMQNSPPGSKPAKPTGAAAAAEIPSPEPETVDGDAEDVCGMDHDAPPTPKEPAGALAPSPAPPAASAKKRDAKPPRSGKKSKRARTPSLRAPEEKEEEALEEGDEEEGPSPPAADFEAMLAKAMAAADGGNVDAVLGGASRKTMNSPAPPRRKTPARSAKAKTPEGTPMRETRSSARVTRASAAKTKTRVAHRNVQNTPTPRGKKRGSSPTPEKRKKLGAAKPAWVSDVTPDPEPEEAAKEETAEENASLDRSSSDGSGSEDVSPVPEAPAAPPPPPAAWIKKTAEAKTSLKPAWVSEFAAPAAAPAAPVVAAPVAPVAAPVVIAALAAAQSRAKAASLSSDGFDFEAKLQAALAAEAGGGAAAFGGASKVANSPTGSGEKRTEFSAKEEARRQGVTVAQIMHARAHADSSPLTKVRF